MGHINITNKIKFINTEKKIKIDKDIFQYYVLLLRNKYLKINIKLYIN